MSGLVVQEVRATSGGTAATSQALPPTTVGTGNTLHVAVQQSGGGTFTVTDSAGNTYTQLDTGNYAGASYQTAHFLASNVTGGSLTITAHSSVSQTYFVVFAREISGVTGSPLDVHALTYGTTSGPQNLSVNLTTTGADEFISSFGGATGAAAVTAVTGTQDYHTGNTATSHAEAPTAGAQTVTFATTGGYPVVMSVALRESAGVGAPTLTSVNGGGALAEGATSVPLVGTGFVAGMTVNILQGANTIAQANVTVTSSTAAAFDLVTEPGTGAQAKYDSAGSSTTLKVTVSGQTSAAIACPLKPPSGQLYVNVASINSTSTYDIQATPALAVGDQIEASGSSDGTSAAPTGLQLNTDTTYQYTSGSTPVNFWARAWDSSTSTWGAWALQTVQQTVTITVPTGLIQALHQFFSLLPG